MSESSRTDGRTCRWRILEPNASGHRFWYVGLLLESLVLEDPDARVLLVTRPQALDHPSWREHIEPRWFGAHWKILTTKQSPLQMVTEALLSNDRLVIPDADGWLVSLLLAPLKSRRRVRGAILLMRPAPDATTRSRLRHVIKRALLQTVRVLNPNLNIFALTAVAKAPNDLEDPVQFAPAPVARERWLEQNDLRSDLRWLVALGEASERKCIDLLGRAVASQKVAEAGWGLVVLGRPSSDRVKSELTRLSEENPGRVVFRPQFLTDSEFDTWLQCADAVPVLHRNEGSSGVLLKCWAAGTPALVGGARSVIAAADELGLVHRKVPVLQLDELISCLSQFIPERTRTQGNGWQSRTHEFARKLLR